MGGNSSKPSIISYEEAVKRISDVECRRIKEAFKRSAGANGSLLSKNAFVQEVLCEGTPSNIAEWLFQACGGTSKGINFKDLISALVLITRGTQDEKIRFLWTLYSNDSSTLIIKNDFYKALQIEATYQNNSTSISSEPHRVNHINNNINNNNVSYNYLSLFGSSSSVSFDQFRSWVLIHKSATVLSKWLLVDSCVNLSSDLETPTFYQSLAGVTHLEESEICDLEKVFWYLKSCALSGQLDIESLTPLLSPPLPQAALMGFFSAFDENCDGHIDFKELCCGVSCSCRGPDVERTKFCFKIFDNDRDGILNSGEVNQMITIMLIVAKECCMTNSYKNVTFDQIIDDLRKFLKLTNSDAEFSITQEDFLMWCVQSALNISQPFIDLVFEVCHIVFGLRPQCKHLEFKIVKGWLARETRRGYEVGQFWYLVSSEWWQNWLVYTHNNNHVTPCTYCKSLTTRSSENADEAIYDECCASSTVESNGNITETGDSSSLGSGSSGISMGRHSSIPGPIDNSILLAANPYKTVPTLTGEGGKLKREIPLVQHRDFELIPEALWKALSQWYGGNLALPRQVVKPPNTEEKELELYPLNLRVLRHHQQQQQQQQHNQISSSAASTSSWNSISGGYGALANASYSSTSNTSNSSSSLQSPKKYLAYIAAFSRLATVKQVAEFLCARLKLKQDTIRLWHMGQNGDAPYLLEDESLTLEGLNFIDNDQLLLEIRNKDLTWPEELRAISSQNHIITQDRRGTVASVSSLHTSGATGLHNLGNTCFMNSALQVLFNTKPLTEYFRQNIHLFELNTNNKMGTKGHLAIRYADLLKEILSAQTRSIAPLKFRFCVSKFAPQFSGGGQHDSQELLDWLLDTLHEDLNRVNEKPYIEVKDSNGRSDQIVAAESWEATLRRNRSVIVDLFYGQMKSKVTCETCGMESVRFDPFSLLSLPLPVENYTYCEVLVTKLDGSCPVKYGIRLNSDCKYWDLKNHLTPMCGIEPRSILLCQLEGAQVKYILANEMKINSNTSHLLYAYELPKTEHDRSRTGSEIGNIEKGLKDIQRSQADQQQLTSLSVTPSSSSTEEIGLNPKKTSKDSQTEKDTIDMLGTSPMGTFMEATAGTYNMKTISTTNLLSTSLSELPANGAPVHNNNNNHMNGRVNNGCNNCNINNLDYDEDDISITSSRDHRRCINYEGQCDYLIAVHRKFTRQDTYFLSHHKTKPSLFGCPLLIPLHEGVQNKDLYCSVWMQVSRLLSPLPPSSTQNHAEDCDDSLGYDFPFTLRAVKENGQVCALCPWARFCRGCQIPCNDEMFLHGIITSSCCSSNSSTPNLSAREVISLNTVITSSSVYIAIDWDTSALHLRYQSTREKIFQEHSSLAVIRRQQTEPVDLDHCLRAFTSEEKLEQTYYCSHCKSKQPATKKLQLWKLPPVLIVHLKRFNFMNNKWVKSQKVVNFPFDNFDPTPYLASVPQETILRHRELLEQKTKNIRNHDCDDEITEFDLENDIPLNESRVCDIIQENGDVIIAESSEPTDGKSPTRTHPNTSNNSKTNRRKRLVSTSLTKTPIVDGDLNDFNNHRLKLGADPLDLKYKLYAVVSHSGMLNGGHYVAYALNANNKSWYCYNDSSCREINQQPNIDPSSAYLLFYERQNLDYLPYLPKIENKQPLLNGNELLEESDNELKKACVLS
ncbi:CLUMA_CG011444, isoform A [Clunio marinus]|uniref:ubiquitinyl hydrolase 1 n=1 Tax=Clunio marinus TaxID=568069 RepID=A0A1J1ICZ0_9DIPT|nr:CLUMA_CG011444, isoform A [Clunio marinus]